MKYLITGGAGFIGSHLAERLLADGHEVIVLDNLSTGSAENLKPILMHPRFKFILGAVETSLDLGSAMAWADTVFHLAAAVGVDLVVTQPVHTIHTNIHATEKVLDYAVKTGTKVMLASTSEVYGKAASDKFRETDDLLLGSPVNFRWSYAASKALDEYLAMAYRKERNLKVVITRFFNTVGPRQSGAHGMVVPRFVQQSMKGEALRVFGDGEQIRCFCHVLDTVEALVRLDQKPQALGEIFNIGTSTPMTILQLAERVNAIVGNPAGIVRIPYSEAYAPGFEDMMRRIPDTGKLRNLTGWEPIRDLDEIIREVHGYFRSKAQA
jgi:UDP-glucose 4-epimerase